MTTMGTTGESKSKETRRIANKRAKLLKGLCAGWVKENEPKVYEKLGKKAAKRFPKAK